MLGLKHKIWQITGGLLSCVSKSFRPLMIKKAGIFLLVGAMMTGLLPMKALAYNWDDSPTASISYSSLYVYERDWVTLDGSGSYNRKGGSINYEWRDNGSLYNYTSSGSGTFPIGEHNIKLTVTNNIGLKQTAEVMVTVYSVPTNKYPIISMSINPTDAAEGQDISFSANGSYDPEGKSIYYEWYDNGVYFANISQFPKKLFPGPHEIKLKVRDADGMSAEKAMSVYVRSVNLSPIATIKTSATIINQGETIEFDGSDSSDPNGDQLIFTWADGWRLLSSEAKFSQRFDTVGTYNIRLLVNDNRGLTDSKYVSIVVNTITPPSVPIAVIDCNGTTMVERETAIYCDAWKSSDPKGSQLTYEWRIDGIIMPNTSRTAYLNGQVGQHTATLKVKNALGVTSTNESRWDFTVTATPKPSVYTVGNVKIYADTIETISTGVYKATGNIRLGSLSSADTKISIGSGGFVVFDTNTKIISGNGLLTIAGYGQTIKGSFDIHSTGAYISTTKIDEYYGNSPSALGLDNMIKNAIATTRPQKLIVYLDNGKITGKDPMYFLPIPVAILNTVWKPRLSEFTIDPLTKISLIAMGDIEGGGYLPVSNYFGVSPLGKGNIVIDSANNSINITGGIFGQGIFAPFNQIAGGEIIINLNQGELFIQNDGGLKISEHLLKRTPLSGTIQELFLIDSGSSLHIKLGWDTGRFAIENTRLKLVGINGIDLFTISGDFIVDLAKKEMEIKGKPLVKMNMDWGKLSFGGSTKLNWQDAVLSSDGSVSLGLAETMPSITIASASLMIDFDDLKGEITTWGGAQLGSVFTYKAIDGKIVLDLKNKTFLSSGILQLPVLGDVSGTLGLDGNGIYFLAKTSVINLGGFSLAMADTKLRVGISGITGKGHINLAGVTQADGEFNINGNGAVDFAVSASVDLAGMKLLATKVRIGTNGLEVSGKLDVSICSLDTNIIIPQQGIGVATGTTGGTCSIHASLLNMALNTGTTLRGSYNSGKFIMEGDIEIPFMGKKGAVFTLSAQQLVIDSYTIRSLNGNNPIVISLMTPLLHTLSGSVKDSVNRGISGIKINIESTASSAQKASSTTNSNQVISVVTDTAGNFSTKLAVGSWKVTPASTQYTLTPASATVLVNGNQQVSFRTLTPDIRVSIGGLVKDQYGKPIAGAIVASKSNPNIRAVTNVSGLYKITLNAGSGWLTVTKSPYYFKSASYASNMSQQINFIALPTYIAFGYVKKGSMPIQGVAVKFNGLLNISAYTNKNGYYQITLPAGLWRIEATKMGARFSPASATLDLKKNSMLNFTGL